MITGIIASQAEKLLTDYLDGQWQLTDANTGQNIVTFTSFIDAEIKDESKVVSAPIEEGSFASYNKVESPLEIKVTLGLSGSTSDLQNALDSLTKYAGSTDLVNLVTPTAEYESLNLERFDYSLKREIGRGALYVSLSLKEIKQVQSEYTNAEVAPQQDRGKVQTKDAGSAAKSGSGSGSGSGSSTASAPRRSMLRSMGDAVRGS